MYVNVNKPESFSKWNEIFSKWFKFNNGDCSESTNFDRGFSKIGTFLGSIGQTTANVNTPATTSAFAPLTAGTSADYCVGLKNWFGQIIHSFH